MSIYDKLYSYLPVSLQHAVVSTYGLYWRWLRFGTGYVKSLSDYLDRENYQIRDWDHWQSQRLQEVLAGALSVPYYSQTWNASQKASALAGCLSDLPLLEKAPIRADPKAFLRADIHPRHPQVFLTSGSTGTPISSYYTIHELRESLALREARSARWAGVSFSMPRATFSGRMVEPNPNSNGPFHRFNIAENQVYFSAFHLKPDTAHQYVDALNRHRVRWGTGYAVSFYLLARFMLERGIAPPADFEAIITTSEKLTPEMRSVMEQAYGCKVYEEYSTVENAIFASECEHGRLHVSPDISIVEILRPDGTSCLSGEAGEVVVTSLAKMYQPLIRFRIGDMAMWDAEPCPCRRQMPVIKEVLGRIEDVVIGPDGRQIVRFHGVFVNQPHVHEGQIIQESLDFIRVKVVPAIGFGTHDIHDIVHRVQQRLGDQVKVLVESVEEIPRTKAGKFQAVISYIKKNNE
jgi:phenylacetate-CoA ligase